MIFCWDHTDITIGFTSATTATNESTGYVTVCIKIQTGILERSANVYVSTMDGTAINSSKPPLNFLCSFNDCLIFFDCNRQLFTSTIC